MYLIFHAMLTVNPLLHEEIQTSEETNKNHPCQAPRIRTHAILCLSPLVRLKALVKPAINRDIMLMADNEFFGQNSIGYPSEMPDLIK